MTQTYGSTPSCENINCIVDPGFKATVLHLNFFFLDAARILCESKMHQ